MCSGLPVPLHVRVLCVLGRLVKSRRRFCGSFDAYGRVIRCIIGALHLRCNGRRVTASPRGSSCRRLLLFLQGRRSVREIVSTVRLVVGRTQRCPNCSRRYHSFVGSLGVEFQRRNINCRLVGNRVVHVSSEFRRTIMIGPTVRFLGRPKFRNTRRRFVLTCRRCQRTQRGRTLGRTLGAFRDAVETVYAVHN